MVRRQDFGFTLESGKSIRIVCERLWQHLHVPVEFGVPGSIHLTHAAFADLGGDVVVAESGTDFECHKG